MLFILYFHRDIKFAQGEQVIFDICLADEPVRRFKEESLSSHRILDMVDFIHSQNV